MIAIIMLAIFLGGSAQTLLSIRAILVLVWEMSALVCVIVGSSLGVCICCPFTLRVRCLVLVWAHFGCAWGALYFYHGRFQFKSVPNTVSGEL